MKKGDVIALVVSGVVCVVLIGLANVMSRGDALRTFLQHWYVYQWSLISVSVILLSIAISIKIFKWYMKQIKKTMKEGIKGGIKEGLSRSKRDIEISYFKGKCSSCKQIVHFPVEQDIPISKGEHFQVYCPNCGENKSFESLG